MRQEETKQQHTKQTRRNDGQSQGAALVAQTVIWLVVLLVFIGIGIGIGWLLWGKPEKEKNIDLKAVKAPSWIEQDFIRKNIYSRPAVSLKQVEDRKSVV